MKSEDRSKKELEVNHNGILQFRAMDKEGENWLENSLKNNTITFGSPKNFNDAFDCNLPLASDCKFGEIYKYFEMINRAYQTGKDRKELIDLTFKHLESPDLLQNFLRSHLSEKHRFTCFSIYSEENLYGNSRFWAEYGGKHHGICLKFSGDIFGSGQLFKNSINVSPLVIEYCSEIPYFNYIKYRLQKEEDGRSIQYLMGTKSKDYEFENELRYVYKSDLPIADDYISVEFYTRKLEAVYLGRSQTEQESTQILQLLSSKKYDHVDIFKLEPEKKRFRFEPILKRPGKK